MKKPRSFTLADVHFLHGAQQVLILWVIDTRPNQLKPFPRLLKNNVRVSFKSVKLYTSCDQDCVVTIEQHVAILTQIVDIDNVNNSGPWTGPWGLCSIFYSCEAAPITENNCCLPARYDSRDCRTFPAVCVHTYITYLSFWGWSGHNIK